MSDQDALGADMHPLPGFLAGGPPAGDQDPLERLLEDPPDPGSVPPGDGGLARLLAAATAPATPDELAGQQRALAEFTAVLRSTPPTRSPRRTAMARKILTSKAAAAALVAVLSVGGIAAATGQLPGQAERVADQPAATTTADTAGHRLGRAAAADLGGPAQAGAAHAQGRASTVGPDATAAARAGLCQAWQSGQGTDQGRRMDAAAFQALAAAAGGADTIAGYCQDVTAADHGQGQASPPRVSAPPTTAPPAGSGPPATPGPPASTGPGGHGQGDPPTTTG